MSLSALLPVVRLLATLAAGVVPAVAAQPYPPKFEDARTETYKATGDTRLSLHVFEPATGPKVDRPAVVFFFGGSWKHGSPAQFEQHCRHLASRGVVAIAADYRVAERHGVKPVSCVADAKSAIRFVRTHATRLGIAPQRIAAAGGSAGGHLAAAAALVPGFDDPGEDSGTSSVPDALVLFNPPLVLAPLAGMEPADFTSRVSAERMGTDPKNLSPAHHVRTGAPPTIIFHGKADTTVPYATAEAFTRAMIAADNRCELVGYPRESHGFFNFGRGDGANFRDTLARTDAFLVSLGWIDAATVAAPPPQERKHVP